jgi:hypothetical protein
LKTRRAKKARRREELQQGQLQEEEMPSHFFLMTDGVGSTILFKLTNAITLATEEDANFLIDPSS